MGEAGTVVPFPGRFRLRPLELPADAKPVGRPCCVMIYPDEDGWDVIECSGDGASYLGHGLSKRQALLIGLDFVSQRNAELTLSNSNPYEREWA